MVKCQTESMQTHATTWFFLTAILAIAYNRMADVSHMDTDLVFTTRKQMQK